MTRLEKVSNIAVIVAAIVVTAVVIFDRLQAPAVGGEAREFAKRYAGKPVPLRGIGASASEATLVLFASNSCHFCAESFPFYRRLARLRSESSARLKLVAVYPRARQTAEETKDYFVERGVTMDAVEPAAFPSIGVNGTPTLALVDRTGLVRDVWVGKLSLEQEAEVFLRIGSICQGCAVADHEKP